MLSLTVEGRESAIFLEKELMLMPDKNSVKNTKRLSKSQRKHVRRLKQAARKEITLVKTLN